MSCGLSLHETWRGEIIGPAINNGSLGINSKLRYETVGKEQVQSKRIEEDMRQELSRHSSKAAGGQPD